MATSDAPTLDPSEAELLDDTMHIEDEPIDFVDIEVEGSSGLAEDAVESFNEAFNARDLDRVLELLASDVEAPGLGNDRDNIGEALEDLWDRRPTCVLTRGTDGDRCVSVLWEVVDAAWVAIAPVFFDDCGEGAIGMLELADDPGSLERIEATPPENEFEEGATWEEWESGAAV